MVISLPIYAYMICKNKFNEPNYICIIHFKCQYMASIDECYNEDICFQYKLSTKLSLKIL